MESNEEGRPKVKGRDMAGKEGRETWWSKAMVEGFESPNKTFVPDVATATVAFISNVLKFQVSNHGIIPARDSHTLILLGCLMCITYFFTNLHSPKTLDGG